MHLTTTPPSARHAHKGPRPTTSMTVEATRHINGPKAPGGKPTLTSTEHSTDFIPLPASAFRADPRSISQADSPSMQPVTDIQHLTAWVDAWQNGAPGERSKLTQPVVHAKWLQVAGLPNTAVTPMLWATAHINSLAQQVAAHTKGETAAARLLLPHDTPCTVKGPGKASVRSSQTGM